MRYLKYIVVLVAVLFAANVWCLGISYEDETSYTSLRGSFADGQSWMGGLIPTALSNNVTGITKANPGVVSSTSHGLSVGDLVYFDSLSEMTELNEQVKTVSAVGDADNFSINDTSGYGAAETTGGACGHSVVSLATQSFQGNILVVYDSGGNRAIGYIGDAGTGETLGGELVTNGDFTNWTGDDPDNWQIGGEDGVDNYIDESAGGGEAHLVSDGTFVYGMYADSGTANKLYKLVVDVTDETTGTVKVRYQDEPDYIEVPGVQTHSVYIVADATGSTDPVFSRRSGATDVTIDNFSIKEVTESNANAVHIYKEPSCTNEGWHEIDDSFDPNDITTFDVHRLPGKKQNW